MFLAIEAYDPKSKPQQPIKYGKSQSLAHSDFLAAILTTIAMVLQLL